MSHTPELPNDVARHRVRRVRQSRGMTVPQLSEKCADLGCRTLSPTVLYNWEIGKRQGKNPRQLGIDELMAIAYALNVAPVHLLVPTDAPDDQDYRLTGEKTTSTRRARAWVRGLDSLGQDERRYLSEVPAHEFVNISMACDW